MLGLSIPLIAYAAFLAVVLQFWPLLRFKCGQFWPVDGAMVRASQIALLSAWGACVAVVGVSEVLHIAFANMPRPPLSSLLLCTSELVLLAFILNVALFKIYSLTKKCSST